MSSQLQEEVSGCSFKGLLFKILLFLSLSSCAKEEAKPLVQLSVQYLNTGAAVEWRHIEGIWNAPARDLFIDANGCQNEHFKLYLPAAKDTGTYTKVSIRNVYFSDAQEIPPTAAKGSIKITHVDAFEIKGMFNATLKSSHVPQSDIMLKGSFSLKSFQ
jgi:hypothetical protein